MFVRKRLKPFLSWLHDGSNPRGLSIQKCNKPCPCSALIQRRCAKRPIQFTCGTGHPDEAQEWWLQTSPNRKKVADMFTQLRQFGLGVLPSLNQWSSRTEWILYRRLGYPFSRTRQAPTQVTTSLQGSDNKNTGSWPRWTSKEPSPRVPDTWPVPERVPFGLAGSAGPLSFESDNPKPFSTAQNQPVTFWLTFWGESKSMLGGWRLCYSIDERPPTAPECFMAGLIPPPSENPMLPPLGTHLPLGAPFEVLRTD